MNEGSDIVAQVVATGGALLIMTLVIAAAATVMIGALDGERQRDRERNGGAPAYNNSHRRPLAYCYDLGFSIGLKRHSDEAIAARDLRSRANLQRRVARAARKAL